MAIFCKRLPLSASAGVDSMSYDSVYRPESHVYLKTVWTNLKMALGEPPTQQQVNALLQNIPSTVYTVTQKEICPAFTLR